MTSHRKAMLNNMAGSVLQYKKIHTTSAKAKAVVPLIDRLIGWAKKDTIHYRRLAFSVLKDRSLVRKLFTEITPSLKSRNSGYTRIIRSGVRHGDGAALVLLQLVGQEDAAEESKEKTKQKKKQKKKK